MLQMVAGRKYSAKLRCLTAVIFDPVTEIMSSLPLCNHQTISEIWSKCTMHRLLKLIQLVPENNHFRFHKEHTENWHSNGKPYGTSLCFIIYGLA